jgi:uncharacterized protein (DUF362 family)/Pyruvate/2-oxoacid:ferredoxin oxidoreductase delta subunit
MDNVKNKIQERTLIMYNKVYIIKCDDYSDVKTKLPELINMMGGIKQYVSEGEQIALKVNLLKDSRPEEAVTTHPSIVSAIAKMLIKINAESLIIDSPGSGYSYNEKMLDKIYRTTEMYKAAEESGTRVNLDCSSQEVSYPEGKLIKRFEVLSPLIKADGVFNLCKMKTHLFMRMTGAVKNNFGIIPGLAKPGFHAKLHDTRHFADMLLDLAQYVSPRLTIMDAVVSLEGDGPSAGSPRKVGLLIASVNQLAVDVVAGEIIGLSRSNNPVLLAAEARGLQPNHIKDIEIIGDSLNRIKIPDYKFPANIEEGMGLGPMQFIPGLLKYLFKDAFSARPVISKKKCIACGACIKSCPEKAISLDKHVKAVVIDDKKCIRCYCCHEMCSEKAIDLRYGFIHKMLNR